MHKFFYPLLILLLGWIGAGSYFLTCPTCNPEPAPVKKETIAAAPVVDNVWDVEDGSRFAAGSPDHFTFPNSSAVPNVPAKTQSAFDNVSKYLQGNPARQLLLTGYYKADEAYAGTFANLGVDRAEAIKANLVSNGAPAANIITTGLSDYNLNFNNSNLLEEGVSFIFKGASDLEEIRPRLKAKPHMIYFATGSNQVNLDDALKAYFADIKYYVSQVPDAAIQVSGHTDNVGSLGGNTRLSKKRAEQIKDYMVNQGIRADAITSVIGEGPNRPIATNDTDEGKTQNRRVEIIVTN